MSLTLPNLDDRTFDDLVEEARSLLPVFAPDFTNHNASEPLITLTELFAYFIEVLVYRLNLVTDANRIAFLRLLNGPDWAPPWVRSPSHAPTREEIDAEIRRTVLSLRQTERAVTPADLEFLSRPAHLAARIVRVKCVPGLNLSISDPTARFNDAPGHVSIVVVPNDPLDTDVLDLIESHLEPRRLLTTRVHAVAARYVPIGVQITLHLLPDAREDAVRQRAVDALTAWLDPIAGRDGEGWPFGQSVNVSEIYRLLDRLEGVDFAVRTVAGEPLDELTTDARFADRRLRNEDLDLVSIALKPDELAQARIVAANIHTVLPRATGISRP